jgi:signal transduction histidine kinase
VRKILGHLLENAVRYSPAGGRIDVIVRAVPHHASSFQEICVCDFGLGIANKHRERIFEHFYRVDTRLTREVYGLGLELTVCQYLMVLHRGRIWAESCADGGSAFHLWLTLAKSPTRN